MKLNQNTTKIRNIKKMKMFNCGQRGTKMKRSEQDRRMNSHRTDGCKEQEV